MIGLLFVPTIWMAKSGLCPWLEIKVVITVKTYKTNFLTYDNAECVSGIETGDDCFDLWMREWIDWNTYLMIGIWYLLLQNNDWLVWWFVYCCDCMSERDFHSTFQLQPKIFFYSSCWSFLLSHQKGCSRNGDLSKSIESDHLERERRKRNPTFTIIQYDRNKKWLNEEREWL